MQSPNLNQRLYLARAMNEELEGIFDHDRQLSEAPTRKDFRMVADLIKANPAPAKRNELAKHHAEIFAKQNPRFDREKFMKACDADGTCGSPAPARYSPKNISEDEQDLERKEEGRKEKRAASRAVRKADKAYFNKRKEIMARPGSVDARGYATDAARRKAERTPEARAARKAWAETRKVYRKHDREAEDPKNLYGKGGKIVAKREWVPVKEASLEEGSYQGSQRELRGQRKGSRKLLRKALAKGDKKGAAEWMENIKDAESQIKPKKTIKEGSRGLARHERIIKALKKKTKHMMKGSDTGAPIDHDHFGRRLKLSRGQQGRDRVQISRERGRAGLNPKIPTATVNTVSTDDTGTFRVKSEPRSLSKGAAPARVPKAVLKYREASAAKKAAGLAKKSK